MPFSGPEKCQAQNILAGRYRVKEERWARVSTEAWHFVRSLMEVDPQRRLTAQGALEHPFIVKRHLPEGHVDEGVVKALQQFGHCSKFRRCCMEMMAWSLSNEERAKVCEHFLNLDINHHGTITLDELKTAMENFGVSDDEVRAVFEALDTNHDQEIHYSDFLAAMVSTKIDMNEDLLSQAFKKFDADHSGYITAANLRAVLGDTFEGDRVELLMCEAEHAQEDRLSYPEFAAYLRNTSPSSSPISVSQESSSSASYASRRPSSGILSSCRSWKSARHVGLVKQVLKSLSSAVACQGTLPA
mmetsp:Transcript_37218/g.106305  ORF Transcript_37218/g.106305 Transcript_37218/m.106305 type:complete len:301 (-) Transcript_37218:69-971(-)